MPLRKTEGRIPANLGASDLGQAAVAADGRCALVSFVTSPLVVNRENIYVVFVTDPGLAGAVQTFEWSFVENGGSPVVQTTDYGETSYGPQSIGTLSLTVRLLGPGNAEQASLALDQEIVALQADIEALISNAKDNPGPGMGNPDVARELVNDHSPYYQDIALKTPESGEAFQQFVFGVVSDGALQRTPAQRKQHLDELAASLNTEGANFQTLTTEGAGVCGIRLTLLAMTVSASPGNPPFLDWTELPEPPAERAAADQKLQEKLAALDEPKKIDLFNIVRFPRSNIVQSARIVEILRDHYFSGANFNDVLTGMSGTRAHWIRRHFREGPLVPS